VRADTVAELEALAPRLGAMRGPIELPPDVSVVVPVNAKADLEVVLTVLGDVAGYAGSNRVEVVLVVNNYPPEDPPTDAIAAYERSGIRTVAVPDVFRPGEAVCFSARLPGIRAAGSERIVLFDADCRIRDVTALVDWYCETLTAGAAVAYTPVAYDELRPLWSVRARIAAHHGARWLKRNVLGVPTTRGSNYAVDRGTLLSLHAAGGLADDLNVGPAAKSAGKPVHYSGSRRLTVVTSGRRFGGGWLKLARYLRYRFLYNLRMLRRPSDGRRFDPYHDRRQR